MTCVPPLFMWSCIITSTKWYVCFFYDRFVCQHRCLNCVVILNSRTRGQLFHTWHTHFGGGGHFLVHVNWNSAYIFIIEIGGTYGKQTDTGWIFMKEKYRIVYNRGLELIVYTYLLIVWQHRYMCTLGCCANSGSMILFFFHVKRYTV